MAHEKIRPKYFFDEEKIEQLKQFAPECFEDGKINFETLKQNLGDWTQNEEDPELEHFGLFWPGKRDARKAAALAPEGTLEPVYGDGLKSDATSDADKNNDSKNIFIEGENLEVLKLIQKSYTNKVRMIYIDPPYNTGSDFIYDDDFTEPLQEYLKRTGQVDDEGKTLTTNKRSDGRFHSKWLTMIYPRLRLARNLLREDGVIFVSLDDNEIQNCRLAMNEIFGEENFMGCAVRVSKKANNQGDFWSPNFDYLLTYSKNREFCAPFFGGVNLDAYSNVEESGPRKGEKYQLVRLYMTSLDPMRGCTNQRYFIEAPDGSLVIPPGKTFPKDKIEGGNIPPQSGADKVWRWTLERFKQDKDKIVVRETRSSNLVNQDGGETKWNVFTKTYLNDVINNSSAKPNSLIEDHINQNSSHELKELDIPFDFAKPSSLMKYLCDISRVDEGDIVLDYFAGSGSTGQAALEFSQTKSKIKYILVQLPALIEEDKDAFKQGFKIISDVSKERLRRVSAKLKAQNSEVKTDLGFRVFKLKHSNYKPWKNFQGTSISDLENKLALFNENPLRENFSNEGLLTEIMLLEGFTLCSDITLLKQIKSNKIQEIKSEYCQHSLLVCLDEKIERETIASLSLGDDDIFICLDSAISTEDKLRLSDKGLIKTI